MKNKAANTASQCSNQSETSTLIRVLRALKELEQPTLADIAVYAQTSRPTVQRRLRELRGQYNMTITFIRTGLHRGGAGHYLVEDWGLFKPDL